MERYRRRRLPSFGDALSQGGSSRAPRAQSFQQPRSSDSQPSSSFSSTRDPATHSGPSQWRHVAHDDSALYAQSKASQQSAMKPSSRPRRGDSFTVGKSHQSPVPSTSDPPWSRPSSGYARPSPASHSTSRSSYPDIRDAPRTSVKSDRRYSDAPSRYGSRDRDRVGDPHMVASKSSPDLNKAEGSSAVPAESASSPVEPRTSSDIPNDLGQERGGGYSRKPVGHDQQALKNQAAGHSYGGASYSLGEGRRPGDSSSQQPKRVSEDMYTSDMNSIGDCRPVPSHSLQKYQPDYENVSMLATAPLQSEKISEIVDIEDSLEGDSVSASPQPSGSRIPYCPTPPERDLATLKYIKVNQSHEKYPSWPVSQHSAATEQSQPINTRAQSWTDHTNTSKEFPAKQRLAYQPGLRPLQEKNSPASEHKGEEPSGKSSRNTSDPGLKSQQPEFVYDRYGRVVQKRDMKGRFEDFYQNSKPGYLPPRFDSDGHSYGDKEYNAPSPPERDVAGVDQHLLSEALDEHHSQTFPHQKLPQAQESSSSSSQRNVPSNQRMGSTGDSTFQPASANSPSSKKPPGNLSLSSAHTVGDPRRADMATSPLASPHATSSNPRAHGAPSPSYRDYLYRDSAPGASRSSSRPYIVKQTPYYNTSTQTDVQSYAVKMSDPRAQHCNVEIQVGNVGSQTSPHKEFEEKSIQARMSREFQPSELDPSSPKKASYKDKRNYFQYPFQGMQSIQAKYATDMETPESLQPAEVFSPFSSGDQASIMRKLSEEFYGGNKMALLGEKRHSSASSQEHSPKPVDSSSVSVHSGTMSQAESYSSVIIHPSESAGPFGRDDFGSQSSITDSRNDLTSLSSNSQSSLKDTAPRGRNSLEYFPRSAPRPLQEARKFSSLSSISRNRVSRGSESRPQGQDMYVDTRSHRSGSHRDSSSSSEPSPSQPKTSPDSHSVGNVQNRSKGQLHSDSRTASTASHSQHAKSESADSVFSEHSTFEPKERQNQGNVNQTSNHDSGVGGQDGKKTGSAEMLGRKLSMKKAYGIYDDMDRPLSSPTKDSRSASSSLDMGSRTRGSYSDSKQLGQIQEEADVGISQGNKDGRPHLVGISQGHKDGRPHLVGISQSDKDGRPHLVGISQSNKDGRPHLVGISQSDKDGRPHLVGISQSDKDGRPHLVGISQSNKDGRPHLVGISQSDKDGRPHLVGISQSDKDGRPHLVGISQGDKDGRPDLVRHKTQDDISDTRQRLDSWRDDLIKRTGCGPRTSSEQGSSGRSFETTRPPRLFDGSIDSGVGSEILSRTDGQSTPSEPAHSSFPALEKTTGAELKRVQQQAVLNFVQQKRGKQEHSPESSLYESVGIPRSPHSPTSESVSDLISKTHEVLAKRADSIRRTGSTSSRASSADYVDMNRPRRETEWSRLRNSDSFQYNSSRSSLCSENTYEDISVFAPSTPRSSTQEIPRDGEAHNKDMQNKFEDGLQRGKMDSGVMASPTYKNFPPGPSAPRRRAPPPPPRTPSPEPRTPPALPPRNYLTKEEEAAASEGQKEEGSVEEARIDFKSLVHQWESSSPREDAYAAQLRKQAMKFSGQRSGSTAAPSSMSVIHSRTQMGISTSYKRQPTVAQEATSPGSAATASSVSPSSSSGGSSPQRQLPADASPSGPSSQPSVSLSSHSKELSSQASRENKPVSAVANSTAVSHPPQMHERTGMPSREDPQAARAGSGVPARGEPFPGRDRSVSEVPHKVPERFTSPHSSSRERSCSDSRAMGNVENNSSSAVGPSFHSPTDRQCDQSLPPPPQGDSHDGVIDPSELPPPPPELLNDSVVSFDKGGQLDDDPFADNSYGAHRNRGSRQVGNYQRSASAAAVVRPDSQPPPSPTQAVFSDHKLGGQNWNSDSQLQAKRRSDPQPGMGVSSSGFGGPPGTPDGGSVPAFRADSGPVQGTVKTFGGPQSLSHQSQPQGQSAAGGAGDSKTFTARPFHAGQMPGNSARHEKSVSPARNERGMSPEQSQSVKERISSLERKSSFSSASSSSTPVSTASPQHTANSTTAASQRWPSTSSFQAAQRSGGDSFKPQSVSDSSSSNRVPNPRSAVLTDSYQARERPHSGSPALPAQDPSTQISNTRPRAYSERTRQAEMSQPSAEPKYDQRYCEESPTVSDSRALPGHVRHSPQSPTERPRSSSSPYNRRESAPAAQIPSNIVNMTSPRRKSEGNFLASVEDVQKEASLQQGAVMVSHGRQPSQEELECDLRAKELAREVAESEKKLSDVLSTDASKKRMKYMDGLFSGPSNMEVKTPVSVRRHQSHGSGDAARRQAQQQGHSPTGPALSPEDQAHKRNSLPKEYFVSPPKAVLEMEWRKKEETSSDLTRNIHDSEALIKQKEELIEKLMRKLDLLKEERKGLQEEIQEIEDLGRRVCDAVDTKCENSNERDKFHTYISDLEKIVRLLLNLSGQLARAENAVQALAEDADPEVKKRTLAKRERLQTKHAEAKQLNDDINKRSDTVSAFLRQSLSSEELNDYVYYVKMKSKLTIELQELEDKITLGQEQIQELRKSIPERDVCAGAKSSSSPSSSPVPSS
ncbi:uncharacterized protein LOC143283964 isoform X2 [Babylonia areolata]|uniref:uncharacterized protein LOC143283964 isoform X2 n=1 Tax=Babylonia areolata TaxID=304850 RepID=UPI003FD55490